MEEKLLELDPEDAKKTEEKNKLDLSRLRRKRDDGIRNFVGTHVMHVLEKLYDQLHLEEANPEPKVAGKGSWMRHLYPDGRIPGPLGERPLHVCALMAARFRLGGSDTGVYGVQIADGIVQGIKTFHESGDSNRQNSDSKQQSELRAAKRQSEVRAAYGKDYVAAVGTLVMKVPSVSQVKLMPFMEDLIEWCDTKNHVSLNQDDPDFHRKYHINVMLRMGLYEGETLFFPFIASGDDKAVKWLINLDSCVPRDRER